MKFYKKVHLDFETRSKCDLTIHGTDRYSKDPSTEVTCMAYGFDEEPIKIWRPGMPWPTSLVTHLTRKGEVWAHNSNFEYQIWNNLCTRKYGFTPLELEQTYCTMSMANAMGLMGSLDGAAACAGLPIAKDPAGYRVMMMLCKPKADGTYWERHEVPEKFKKLEEYCVQDVEVERALAKRLAPLSTQERKLWLLDQKINLKGFQIDVSSAKKLDVLVDTEKLRLAEELRVITGNQVPSPQSHAKFKQWLNAQGIETESVDKAALTKLLEEDDGILGGDMPLHVKRAILVRREAAKSSNAKIKMMLNLEVNGRVRNGFEYYGAKQTGRWAGRKLQAHNFPRGKLKPAEVEDVMSRLSRSSAAQEINILYGDVMDVASSCLRGLIAAAPGKRLIAADWANIEGRCLAWLANEEWKIKAFEDFDRDPEKYPDIYKLSYARAFGIRWQDVTEEQRQIGKVMELALGYQGAVGSFQVMAKGYGVKISDARAKELVDAWRAAHPRIRNYWYAVEEAATSAITTPGVAFSVGQGARKIVYIKKGSFLCCKLPSGRVSYYPYPKYEEVDAPWGGKKMSITYMYQDAEAKKWVRGPTYGGSLVENKCQGVCRDFLGEGLLRAEENNYEIVLHVHDEPVSEVDLNSSHSAKAFEKLMKVPPTWAVGFPIAAKGFESLRYKKG